MGRIMAIDVGGKRTGLAVTDPLQIIATGLGTIEAHSLIEFIKEYLKSEQIDRFIVGWPTNWNDTPTHGTPHATKAIQLLQKNFPMIPVEKIDERYTSKMAKDALLEMGLKKKDRRDKKLVDKVAATILLQEYLRSVQGS
ncbi:MAG: Holliday junction resolvase RuvX [Bacteroidetes bacterium]|nr:Holliday junction resolvase RuvX [Bacteroidota bacterium]